MITAGSYLRSQRVGEKGGLGGRRAGGEGKTEEAGSTQSWISHSSEDRAFNNSRVFSPLPLHRSVTTHRGEHHGGDLAGCSLHGEERREEERTKYVPSAEISTGKSS